MLVLKVPRNPFVSCEVFIPLMLPGVLRALEFDRIVEAVRSFALTPMGDERLIASGAGRRPAQGRAAARGDHRDRALCVEARHLRACAPATTCRRFSARWPLRTGRSNRRGCSRWPPFSIPSPTSGRAFARSRRLFPCSSRRAPASPRSRARSRTRGRRSTRRATWSTMPVRRCGASGIVCASSAAGCGGRWNRICAGATPRSTCRTWSSPSGTAATCSSSRPNIAAIFRASCMARRRAAPASFSNRSAPSRSTTTSSRLQEQEIEEVHRILLALTDAFRIRPLDVQRTVEAATELDVLQARARFSELVDGVEPKLTTDGSFELLAARHPLLMPAVQSILNGGDRCRRTGALRTRRRIAAGGRPARQDRTGAGHDPAAAALDGAAHHRAQYRRQDRGAQDRGAARDHGAGRPSRAGRRRGRDCRCSARCSRTSATNSRSKPA